MKKIIFAAGLIAIAYLFYSTKNKVIVSSRLKRSKIVFSGSNENISRVISIDSSNFSASAASGDSSILFDEKRKCFEDYFFSQDCDRSCLLDILKSKNLTALSLIEQNWKSDFDSVEFNQQNKTTQLYIALNQAGLLQGQDVLTEPNYLLGIELLQKIIQEDPQNYMPYAYLAFAYHKQNDFQRAQQVISEMDDKANYYNNYYSDWAAEMMRDASESMGGYAQSTGVYSTLPIPNSTQLNFLLKYHFNRLRMAEAVNLFFHQFRNEHKALAFLTPILDYSFQFMLTGKKGQSRSDLMHKAISDNILTEEEIRFHNFPETCDRKALDEWYLTYRNEIK